MAKYSITLMTDVVVNEPFVVGNVGDDVMYKLTESQVVSILEDALNVISNSVETVEQDSCVDCITRCADCITRIEDDEKEDGDEEEDEDEYYDDEEDKYGEDDGYYDDEEEGDEYDDRYEDEGE
jgi:hypothetical protein